MRIALHGNCFLPAALITGNNLIFEAASSTSGLCSSCTRSGTASPAAEVGPN